jgi:gamma-aminobutyric acid type B receptor
MLLQNRILSSLSSTLTVAFLCASETILPTSATPYGSEGHVGVERDVASANTTTATNGQKQMKLGMISGDSVFFAPVQVGWDNECTARNIECIYLPTNFTYFFENQQDEYNHPCIPLIDQLLEMGVDGLAVASCTYEETEHWQKVVDRGIPMVVFDQKPPDGFPIPFEAYIGTDQKFLGVTMARLLKQLKPDGGTFGMIHLGWSPSLERAEGFRGEIFKDNDREDRAHWFEIELDIEQYDLETDTNNFHWYMDELAKKNPTAMIFTYQTPMAAENYTQFVDMHRHREIIYIGTDGSTYQLDYLARRYVDGLVGQLPYDMGAQSAKILYDVLLDRQKNKTKDKRKNYNHTTGEIVLEIPVVRDVPTNLVAYNLIPITLPTLVVDQNLLGNLVYAGYVCFAVLGLVSLGCILWTIVNRTGTVVRASQPSFLIATAFGILLMASALIPLSYDDSGEPEEMSKPFSIGICMSIPWLAFTGFTCTFSALFSKTWRVNRFFHTKVSFGRLKISELDVVAPFLLLMTLNFIVLICWTVIDPLTYERNFQLGTDYWNREIASVGRCTSEHAVAYLTPLAVCKSYLSP